MSTTEEQMLKQLAEAAGLEPGYWDTWGKWVEIPAATKAQLLQAIGFDISSPEAISDELLQFEARYSRSPLRPVTVVWKSALPAALTVTVPTIPESRWRLAVEPEQGGSISKVFRPSEIGVAEIVAAPAGPQGVVRVLIGGELEPGYHRVTLFVDQAGHETEVAKSLLIVAPDSCYLPPEILPDKKVFGVGVQVPSLSAVNDLGAGDLGHLNRVIDTVAGWGGALVGLNPLHAASYRDAASISPYSPESRSCFSPLLIDIDAAARFLEIEINPAERERIAAEADSLRAAELIDHLGVWHLKRRVLEGFFVEFKRQKGRGAKLAAKFADFKNALHPPVADYAAYRAIQESLEKDHPSIWGWPVWPTELQDRESKAVQEKLEQEKDRVEFHIFLQWLVEEQLARAQERCKSAGMAIGLYLDLALGSSSGGADVWARRDLYALDASLGAPPDLLNVMGQDWGLPPLVPFFMDYAAYGPFIEALRANMRYAGALRIDHFMSLMRLYWVPKGRTAAEGAYLRYPFQELLGILALESCRNRCVVIGEDLGTVPEGLREEMESRSILSYKVFPFMKSDQGFVEPADYPRKALVTSGTHDMATIRGWWLGGDIENWEKFDMIRPPLSADGLRGGREWEKSASAKLLSNRNVSIDPASAEPPAVLIPALSGMLAETPSLLQVIQAEDLFGLDDQVNVPGTVLEHPNWQRRIPVPVDRWAAAKQPAAVIAAVKTKRPPR